MSRKTSKLKARNAILTASVNYWQGEAAKWKQRALDAANKPRKPSIFDVIATEYARSNFSR